MIGGGFLIKLVGGANLLSVDSVILRNLVLLIIWSTLHNVLEFLLFCLLILCLLSFYMNIIAEKAFCLAVC